MSEERPRGFAAPPKVHIEIGANFRAEHFDRQISGVFKRSWLPVCHSFDIPNPGDYKTRQFPGLRANLLITRTRDGAVKAFHNICRHRGNKLACRESGNANVFVCGYHGWAYNLDGSLRGLTDRESFPPMDRETLKLVPVRCEVRHTFVFVNFDDEAEPLESWLEGLGPESVYEGFFDRFKSEPMTTTTVAANWNLGMDAFSESYHTMFVHKNTLTDYIGSDANPNRHAPAIELMRRHARLSVPANPNHRQVATEAMVYKYTAPAMPSFEIDSSGMPPAVNFGGLSDWAFDVVKLYPNAIVLTGRNWFIETYFWPLSKDETKVEWALHLLPPKTWGEKIAQEFPHLVNREVACEDLGMVEIQHEMLTTGVVTDFFLSFQEILLAHHHRTNEEMIAAAGAAR